MLPSLLCGAGHLWSPHTHFGPAWQCSDQRLVVPSAKSQACALQVALPEPRNFASLDNVLEPVSPGHSPNTSTSLDQLPAVGTFIPQLASNGASASPHASQDHPLTSTLDASSTNDASAQLDSASHAQPQPSECHSAPSLSSEDSDDSVASSVAAPPPSTPPPLKPPDKYRALWGLALCLNRLDDTEAEAQVLHSLMAEMDQIHVDAHSENALWKVRARRRLGVCVNKLHGAKEALPVAQECFAEGQRLLGKVLPSLLQRCAWLLGCNFVLARAGPLLVLPRYRKAGDVCKAARHSLAGMRSTMRGHLCMMVEQQSHPSPTQNITA